MLLIIPTGLSTAYAGHGSGGGGGGSGCAGDCIPPTLGIDKAGTTRVNGGLSINSASFDVEMFSQTIPNQILEINKKAVVTLKIFENQGAQNIIHAELHFAPYEKFIDGVWIEESTAHLVWHDEYGEESIGVYDEQNILQNVKITTENQDGFKIIIFEFEPTKILDNNTIMTNIWDENRNSVTNYFENAISIIERDKIEPILENNSTVLPNWIKNTAGWWTNGEVEDDSFIRGIQFLIKNDLILVEIPETTEQNNSDEEIPDWIKNSAKWWSEGLISETQFVSGLQFLINNGIISV